ncbi:MAG TPA: abortive infection family protein [Chitinophagales bacterium]|nr:abortive infection family protein [Chitinophagales bacterium]
MQKITVTTRKNIIDFLTIEGIHWSGSLEETDFLSRIFDLTKMPSTDSRFDNARGDIWQHRINNPQDWEDNWVFSDSRFNLLHCEDGVFMQFLCEMLHPVLKREITIIDRMLQAFNDFLKDDGYELIEKTKIANYAIFVGRQKLSRNISIENRKKEITDVLSEDYICNQITLMESSIENSPHNSIGLAKELIESICKTILCEKSKDVDKDWDLPKLLKEVSKELKLTPKDIPDETKAAETIKKILGSLSAVVQGISELRNQYGSGHGKDAKFKGLNDRHAKLSVGAASTLAIFLLETHQIRQEIENKK